MAFKGSEEKTQLKSEEGLRRELGDFVAMSSALDGVDLRVFLYLMGRINFEELVHVPQIEMAVALGKQQTHISRSLRKLVEFGVLLSGPDGTRASKWRLNSHRGK